MNDLIQKVARLLLYDPETGAFTWKRRDLDSFATKPAGLIWNKKFAGKKAGYLHPSGYRKIRFMGHDIPAHNIAWFMGSGDLPESLVDHRDGDTQNNRFKNLRPATRLDNSRNSKTRSDSGSGVKGVFQTANGRWTVGIRFGGKRKSFGTFPSLEEAKQVAMNARERLHGEFCRHQ